MFYECEDHNNGHQENPQRARQSDRKCIGRLRPTSMKPSIKANNARWEYDPPEAESHCQRVS